VTGEEREDIRKIVSRRRRFPNVDGTRGGSARTAFLRKRAAERLSGLYDRPELRVLRQVARERGIEAWIVGGALRDRLLGMDVAEIDLAVSGDAGDLARELESRGLGRAVFLSGDKRPRVFRVAGRLRTLDIAELEGGSIETDLARRDFSVNALAADLATGEILDPFGGLSDLAARRLRAVSQRNLFDDPLRALRAARFLATHRLRPDRETSAACRRAARGLERIARERIHVEISKLLSAREAAPALAWATSAGLIEPVLGSEASGRAWKKASRSLATLDSPAVLRRPPDRRRIVRLAWLAARLGLAPRRARAWLERMRWPGGEAVAVARTLDLAHAARRARTEDDDWRWVLEAGDRAADALLVLSKLYESGRPSARRLAGRSARRRPLPDVRGGDVVRWLSLEPGPEVGKLLEEVRVEALAGRVRTRSQAREWLTSRRSAIIRGS